MDVDMAIAARGNMAEHSTGIVPDDKDKLPAEKASPSKTKQQMGQLELLMDRADRARGKK